MPVNHVIYGLQIETDVALPGVLVQSSSKPPDVRVWLKERHVLLSTPIAPHEFFYASPNVDERGQPSLRVCRLSGRECFGFFYSDGVRVIVDGRGREVWAERPEGYSLEDLCTYLVGPVMGFVLRLRGVTCLHASAIVINDRAIAIAGAVGAGKSTTAAAFAHAGFPVLSDDVVALVAEPTHFMVQPGYPRLNLWPNSVRMLFGSDDALPPITPTWDKRYFALNQDGQRFESKPVPLGAIYVLAEREAGLAAPVVEEIAGKEALLTLVSNTYVTYLLDRDMQRGDFDALALLLAKVPVRRVRPTADPAGIFQLRELIAADAKRLIASQCVNTGKD